LTMQDSLLFNPPGSRNRPSATCPRNGTCIPPNGTITRNYGDMAHGDSRISGRITMSLQLHVMLAQQATQASSGQARTMAVHVVSTRNHLRRQRGRQLAWDDIPNVPIAFKRLLNPGRKIRTTSRIPWKLTLGCCDMSIGSRVGRSQRRNWHWHIPGTTFEITLLHRHGIKLHAQNQ
jgi:hypothetical protein